MSWLFGSGKADHERECLHRATSDLRVASERMKVAAVDHAIRSDASTQEIEAITARMKRDRGDSMLNTAEELLRINRGRQ